MIEIVLDGVEWIVERIAWGWAMTEVVGCGVVRSNSLELSTRTKYVT